MTRLSSVTRNTAETQISVNINLDGKGIRRAWIRVCRS